MYGALSVALAVAALPVVAGWSYLAFLSLAALRFRPAARGPLSSPPRLAVLVPAHNEAGLVGDCVRSLLAQSYPADHRRVIVIADNCTDETEAEALGAGAEVMLRSDADHPGKGRALRWAMDALLLEPDPPHAFVVVDADSIADPDLLEGLAHAHARGVLVAQADYTVLDDPKAGSGDHLRALAVLLFNRGRNLGRAAAGLPASLLGNGMLLSRALVEVRPWSAFSPAEDLEFAVQCRLAGVSPAFVAAGVRGPMPLGYAAGTAQRERWEGGRLYVLRRLGPALLSRLLRHPDASLLDAFLDLAVPPIGVLAMITTAGLALSVAAAVASRGGLLAPALWSVCVVLAALHVGLGLRAAGANRRSIIVLMGVPRFLLWKLGVYLRLLRGFDPNRWQRSLRKGESL